MELFFDTETSGFRQVALAHNDPKQAWVVQLGAILSDANHIYAEINFIIRPNGRSIHPGAERVHGISTAVASNGVKEELAAAAFSDLLPHCDKLVCHNYKFDIYLVQDLLMRNYYDLEAQQLLEKDYYCTMLNSTQLCKLPSKYKGKFKWPKLTELYQFLFGYEFDGAHDAMADVRATRECYYKMMENNNDLMA